MATVTKKWRLIRQWNQGVSKMSYIWFVGVSTFLKTVILLSAPHGRTNCMGKNGGKSIWLPGPKKKNLNVKKIMTNFLCDLSHIQMLAASFETKRLSILGCAKKTNWTSNVTPKCHPNFVFFTDEKLPLRFAWKLLSMLATLTRTSTKSFRIFWKHLIFIWLRNS